VARPVCIPTPSAPRHSGRVLAPYAMQPLAIKNVADQPKPDELVLYPDYVIGRMLRAGPSLVEADASFRSGGAVDFVLRHRSGQRETIGCAPTAGDFRTILARFAVFCQLPNIYVGQVFFSSDYEREGRVRQHGFSLFLCNEPAMGIWLRLYLHSIERLWPLRQDER
jgi:hypothetical protein